LPSVLPSSNRAPCRRCYQKRSLLLLRWCFFRGAVVAAIRASLDSADDETKHAALSLPNVAAFSGAVVAAEHDSRAGRCVGKVTAPPHHSLQEQRAPVTTSHAGVLVWWLHCRALAAHKPQVRRCAIAERRSGCRRATQAVRHASRRSDSTPTRLHSACAWEVMRGLGVSAASKQCLRWGGRGAVAAAPSVV
jgi:hypothetical protein